MGIASRASEPASPIRPAHGSAAVLSALGEAEACREEVAALQEAFGGEDATGVHERIRALIAEARLMPSPASPDGGTFGLAGGLALGSSVTRWTREGPRTLSRRRALASVVAGARNQLDLLTRG